MRLSAAIQLQELDPWSDVSEALALQPLKRKSELATSATVGDNLIATVICDSITAFQE
jgi:hypothetical protein